MPINPEIAAQFKQNSITIETLGIAMELGKYLDLTNRLGLSNDKETVYAYLLIGRSIIKDQSSKRVQSRNFVEANAPTFIPRFILRPLLAHIVRVDTDSSKAEQLYTEFLKLASGDMTGIIGENRRKTIELAVHNLMVSGLVEGGEQENFVKFNSSAFSYSCDERLEQWSNCWKERLTQTPPLMTE